MSNIYLISKKAHQMMKGITGLYPCSCIPSYRWLFWEFNCHVKPGLPVLCFSLYSYISFGGKRKLTDICNICHLVRAIPGEIPLSECAMIIGRNYLFAIGLPDLRRCCLILHVVIVWYWFKSAPSQIVTFGESNHFLVEELRYEALDSSWSGKWWKSSQSLNMLSLLMLF